MVDPICIWSGLAFLAVVIELLLCFVLKVGFYIMKWNVTNKCVSVCVRACVHVLNFCFAYLSLRRRTIFYIGTLLILIACVCVCVCACVRACALVQVYVRVRAGICMSVWVLFCWCKWVYTFNYASWCMSVLLFAYVCMLTAFETLSL